MPVEMNFTLPDVSFLNYMGELQADALGIPARFNSNDPVSYFEQSVDRLNSFLTQSGSGIARNGLPYQQQGQGRVQTGDEWDRIMRENTPPDQRGSVNAPPGSWPGGMSDGGAGVSTGNVPFDLGQWIGKNVIGEDFSKRIALFILAVIVVAAAVFSLR